MNELMRFTRHKKQTNLHDQDGNKIYKFCRQKSLTLYIHKKNLFFIQISVMIFFNFN